MSKRVLTIALAAAVAAVLSLVTAAMADSVKSGKTKLALDPDTAEALADMSIGVEPTGNARFAQGFFKFEVKNGQLVDGQGQIVHKGGISFFEEGETFPDLRVKFSKFVLRLGNSKGKIFAKSDHSEVRLFDVDLGGQAQGKGSFDFRIKDADTTLAKPGAEVLSETFDFDFHKGIEVGHLTTKATLGPDVPPTD